MKYQTDFTNEMQICKSGCFVCSIATECEKAIGHELSHSEFLEVVADANKKHILAFEYRDYSKPGCFIMDDEAFGNLVLDKLKSTERYHSIGRIYTQEGQEHCRDTNAFASDNTTYQEISGQANIIILQVQTENGGHFRGLDHDPYRPGTKTKYIKSFRYARIY